MRKETRCRNMGYSFRLTARVLLYAPSHRQDSTYHGLWYTSRGALAGTRNSSMGPPWRIDPTTHRTMSERSCLGATSRSLEHLYPTFISSVWIRVSVGVADQLVFSGGSAIHQDQQGGQSPLHHGRHAGTGNRKSVWRRSSTSTARG